MKFIFVQRVEVNIWANFMKIKPVIAKKDKGNVSINYEIQPRIPFR